MNRRAIIMALRRATGGGGLMPKGGTRRMQRIADRDTVLADKGWDAEGRAFDKYESTRQLIGGRDHPRTGRETMRSEGAGRKVADALFGGAIDKAQAVRTRGLKAQRAAQMLQERPRRTNASPISVVDNEFDAPVRAGRFTPKSRDVIGALRSMGVDDEGLSNAAYVAAKRAYQKDGMDGLKAWAAARRS